MLASTSDIIKTVPRVVESQREIFFEIGCYIYRTSFAVMELQTTENPPENAREILESLSRSINEAKDLVSGCRRRSFVEEDGSLPSDDSNIRSTISQLEEVIKRAGEILRSIPSSTFIDNEYSEMAVRSIASEMQNAQFKVLQKEEAAEEQVTEEAQREPIESSDLYPTNADFSTNDSQVLDTKLPQLIQFLRRPTSSISRNQGLKNHRSISTASFPDMAIEPLYETFCCPLTKQVMEDPVTIQSGVTFERKAITKWFQDEFESSPEAVCPVTALKLTNTSLRPNVALRTTIEEWKERNEAAKIKVCRAALSLASTASMAVEAVRNLQQICTRNPFNKMQVCNAGILPLLDNFLSHKDRDVRIAVLEFLVDLAEEDDGKARVPSLSAGNDCKNSGLVSSCETPVKWPPGPEEVQIEMASYLGEISLGHESQKTYVADRASPVLIRMVHNGNALTRRAAFKALAQISSYHPNANTLTEAGILHIMVEEMFTRRIYNEPMDSKNEAAAILANILEAGVELQNLKVNSYGHKLTSDYVVYNIIHMLNNSTPEELNINLIRIILCLADSPNSMATIVSVVKKQSEVSYNLIELINNPHEELGVSAIKLLIKLSPYMGHTVIERLCKTRGLPENLILDETAGTTARTTERQALSALFLAKLPHKNLTLNLALVGLVPRILDSINQIQSSGTRSSRHSSAYLEGLVGVLVRFTSTLYEPQMLFLARTHNFTSVFTQLLLTKTSNDEVQRLSAFGLENLSAESVNLSKPPKTKKPTSLGKSFSMRNFLSFGSSNKRRAPLCPVHRGVCSSQDTFCLVDANAVERLLTCLDHENAKVVDAALSAICTLLDDRVDIESSIAMLIGKNAVKQILHVVTEHGSEALRHKCFWFLERFLESGADSSVGDISMDRSLPAIVISAFHHGDGNTRQMAEKILGHLNRVPNYGTTHFTM
ncbi:unnamed protein product [Linum tenue]|uniref:RING-type E3 ubiquitin transferase n=1 Tax=Linum tenue TaxID=586396 RepID=A0AAV0J8J4_9ROSI|nr:unnamed protein product [Linum tenue]